MNTHHKRLVHYAVHFLNVRQKEIVEDGREKEQGVAEKLQQNFFNNNANTNHTSARRAICTVL